VGQTQLHILIYVSLGYVSLGYVSLVYVSLVYVSVPLGDLSTSGTKRYISTSGTASTTGDVRMMANFVGNIRCSVCTIYTSSDLTDVRIKKKY
jgi:hypothetical protein